MNLRAILLLAMLSLMQLQAANVVRAQARSGAPGGPPASIGPPMGQQEPGALPSRGPPDAIGDPPAAAQFGLQRAAEAQSFEFRLAKPQADRAAERAKANPDDYELDRNGALAISGEVLASDLSPSALARIEKAGFVVVRRSEIEELGTTLTVVTHPGLSGRKALDKLHRIDPEGSYDLNHVFSETGLSQSEPTITPRLASTAGRAAMVGLIDTGVASSVDRDPRVRIVRRAFAPGLGGETSHGSAVAEVLARAPGKVLIYAADIFGNGRRNGSTEQLLQALGWMARERVPVINISMVGPPNALVANVVGKMIESGFVLVAPVGNDGAVARLLYPASYPGVIAVSACGPDGRLLPEASRVRRIDFVAVGVAFVHDPAGIAIMVRGTSFAAPVVSRRLAEDMPFPAPASARQAITQLRKEAMLPKADRRWFGSGIVAEAR